MKRYQLAGLVGIVLNISVGLTAGNAAADGTPNQPPTGTPNQPPSGTPNQPPPTPTTPPPLSSGGTVVAAPAVGSGAVRLHVTTEKNKGTARLYIRKGEGYALVCSSPCTADVPAGSEMRVTLNNNDDDPHTFTVPNDMGSQIDLQVKTASIGGLIAGIVLMGVGGAFVVSGLLFVALGSLEDSTSRTTGSSSSLNKDVADAYRVTGYVCIGLGAAAAVAGIVVLTTRSKEPRITQGPHALEPTAPPKPDVYGRASTFLGDVAVSKHVDPTSTAPAIMPLAYSFAF